MDITSTLCSRIRQIAAGFSPVLAHWGSPVQEKSEHDTDEKEIQMIGDRGVQH